MFLQAKEFRSAGLRMTIRENAQLSTATGMTAEKEERHG
jgi:hypothetical protein